MSREALNESLSAIMDGEANELEVRRVLATLASTDARTTWSHYQVARAVMHKYLLEPRLDIAAGVCAALGNEPFNSAREKDAGKNDGAGKAVSVGRWRAVGRLAVAASVTIAVLVGVRLYNDADMTEGQLAEQSKPAPSMPASGQTQAQMASYPQTIEPQAEPAIPTQPAELPATIAPIKAPQPEG